MSSRIEEIEKLIEEEVESRFNAKLEPLIRYMSTEWNINPKLITQCISTLPDAKVTTCLAYSKRTHKRCKNTVKAHGYCRLHQDSVKRPEPILQETLKHTHTLPPFFKAGCPACENRNRFRDSELELDNE